MRIGRTPIENAICCACGCRFDVLEKRTDAVHSAKQIAEIKGATKVNGNKTTKLVPHR